MFLKWFDGCVDDLNEAPALMIESNKETIASSSKYLHVHFENKSN